MAGGKANTFDNDLLKLVFNAIPISNIADNALTSPLTNLYVSLHQLDPGIAGTQNTSEANYGSYTRVAVARNSGGWIITGGVVNPAAVITFPTATSGSETETWFAVGTLSSGAGKILYRGPITAPIPVSAGTQPQLSTATAITEG